jgi:hypothetical protein
MILQAAGMTPDPWQAELLRSSNQETLVLCSRQVGKTAVATAEALRTAILEWPGLVLVVTPSERQSAEFMEHVRRLYAALRNPVRLAPGSPIPLKQKIGTDGARDVAYYAVPAKVRETVLQLHLDNGSQIIGLPSSDATIRGYSGVNLLILDEAARIPDGLYNAVRPMLSVSKGRKIALSTPFGKRGWFYEQWTEGPTWSGRPGEYGWRRVQIKATECQRLSPEFLANERAQIGERWFQQEYMCGWSELIGSVFRQEDIDRAFDNDLEPLDLNW